MAFNHVFVQTATTPEGTLQDSGTTSTGDTTTAVSTTVAANGGSDNVVSVAFTAAGLQSLLILSTVPCVLTLTGATVINGVTIGTVTVAANVTYRVSPAIGTFTGNVTSITVGPNTTVSGAAGTIQIRTIFNS